MFSSITFAIVFTVLLWWLSTGVLLGLNLRASRHHAAHLWVMSLLALLALYGIHALASQRTLGAAYASFTLAVVVWAWHEMAFLTGFVTGSRQMPCPKATSLGTRFWFALQSMWHHELALIANLAALFLLSKGEPNQVAVCTFGMLWIMRLSAKLNLFFGVRNRMEEFLPDKLKYLASYFGSSKVNWFLVASILAGSLATYVGWQQALGAQAGYQQVHLSLLCTLLTLAVVEHWFMVLPLPTQRLWAWAQPASVSPPTPIE